MYQFSNLFYYFTINFHLMSLTKNILSPIKENQQPASRDSPSKLQKNYLIEILLYLKENQINLPSHLKYSKNLDAFTLKHNNMGNSSSKNISELKSLKIKLNDTQFELKKLEEDFAQYKRNAKIDKEKDQKKFEQTLQRLKEDSKQNKQDHDFILSRNIKEHQDEIESLKSGHFNKMQQLQKQLKLKHSTELSELQHKIRIQKQGQEIQFNSKYSKLNRELCQQIQALKKQFQKQTANLIFCHNEKMQQAKQTYESTCLALRSQKITQKKLHQKSKIDAQNEKQKIFGDLCYQKNVKNNLEDQLLEKNNQIKQLKQTIQQSIIQIQILKENHQQEKIWNAEEHKKQVEHLSQQYDQKIRNILLSQVQACEKYQNKIERLSFFQQQSTRLHQSKLLELSLKFQSRLSKPQDLQLIKKLTDTLTQKDEEIRKLARELRYRNLQIENKEEVYNKIFKSSTRMREQKKMPTSINKCQYPIIKLERDSWSKESLFRKSQTAEVKVFLQNINKTKRERNTKDG